MSNRPILLIGCDEVTDWSSVLGLEPGAAPSLLATPGAIVPSAPDSPWRRQLEHAVATDGVRDIVLCGHTDCRVIQSRLLGDADGEALKRRYPGYEGQRLLDVAVQESLLAQAERLAALPALRRAIDAGELHIELWAFDAETCRVQVFDPESGQFEPGRRAPSGCALSARVGHRHALGDERL